MRQKDGDFPVQVRPAKPPEVRDLYDASLDDEAEEERYVRPKPHRVRSAVREREPSQLRGTFGDSLKASALQNQSRQSEIGTQIPRFDPEKDLNEEDAAALAATKARALAKRNFKWMPNPYSARPGPLGMDPKAEAKYYERYFDGKGPTGDARNMAGAGTGEEYRELRSPKPKRERIPSRKFWYQPDHVTPDPYTVAFMRSRELKFAMVNEAHLVRKWRNSQPEGRAAGLPSGSNELWMAFGYRAAELATGQPVTVRPPGSGINTGSDNADPTESANAAAAPRVPPQRCSMLSTLRFLQDMASVQAGPFSALQSLVQRVLEDVQDLKPHHAYILLQSLSRLRMRHPKVGQLLERMSVAWMMLPPKKFVRTANAVAKLDFGGHIWARPLKVALLRLLPRLAGPHLALLKGITVMELLNDSAAMRAYLEQCERTRAAHVYPRHLQMVELHAHLLYPDVWEQLDVPLRRFLQEVRNVGEQSRAAGGYAPGGGRSSEESSSESDTDSDAEAKDTQDLDAKTATLVNRSSFDKKRFSSELHQDLSRVLREHLGVDHSNLLAAGPLTVDICHSPTMTVVEAGARWQYYLRSARLTALARRRQELLRAMGFRLVHVSYHRWEALENDEQKAALLRDRLPSELFSHKPDVRLGSDPLEGNPAGASARL